MKPLLVISTFCTVAVALYCIPTGVELLLMKLHVSPWLAFVFLGDLVGCALLFLLGFRKLAAAIYGISIPVKAALLVVIHPRDALVYGTDVIPALVTATFISRAVINMLVTLPGNYDSGL